MINWKIVSKKKKLVKMCKSADAFIQKPNEKDGIVTWSLEKVENLDEYMQKLREYEKLDELLYENPNRFVKFPIKKKYRDIYELGEKQNGNFWVVRELENELKSDTQDWRKLDENKQFFIKNILMFFLVADGLVNENILTNFYSAFQSPEIRYYYGSQIHIEEIHAECYSYFIDNLPIPNEEKNDIFQNTINNPIIKEKLDWGLKWMNDEETSVTEKILAYAFIEGIFFQGSFAAIFWLKENHVMPGLCSGNVFISRDENLHCQAALMIYNKFHNKLPQERVYQILREAVEIEIKFMQRSLPCKLLGMNSDSMAQYIKYVADYWLAYMGLPLIYNEPNPFTFMELLSLETMDSFFETTPNNYRKAGATAEESGKCVFSMDEDY